VVKRKYLTEYEKCVQFLTLLLRTSHYFTCSALVLQIMPALCDPTCMLQIKRTW